VMHKFQKERRINPLGFFECGDTTHFMADCPKRKKYDYSNKNDYNNKNNYKKKNHLRDKKMNIKKIMSRACATLSDFDFSGEESSSLEEDVNMNYKKKESDFTRLCLMAKGRS
jgi:glutaredoxin-related protein